MLFGFVKQHSVSDCVLLGTFVLLKEDRSLKTKSTSPVHMKTFETLDPKTELCANLSSCCCEIKYRPFIICLTPRNYELLIVILFSFTSFLALHL